VEKDISVETDKPSISESERIAGIESENKSLNEQISELKGKLDAMLQLQSEPKKNEPDVVSNDMAFLRMLDDENYQRGLGDDPKNVAAALKNIVSLIGNVLTARDNAISERFARYENDLFMESQSAQELRSEMDELRQDENISKMGLSNSQLAVIARKMKQSKQPDEKSDNFRGAPGGGSVVREKRNRKLESLEEQIAERLYPKKTSGFLINWQNSKSA
jgi:hypothetical protein